MLQKFRFSAVHIPTYIMRPVFDAVAACLLHSRRCNSQSSSIVRVDFVSLQGSKTEIRIETLFTIIETLLTRQQQT